MVCRLLLPLHRLLRECVRVCYTMCVRVCETREFVRARRQKPYDQQFQMPRSGASLVFIPFHLLDGMELY